MTSRHDRRLLRLWLFAGALAGCDFEHGRLGAVVDATSDSPLDDGSVRGGDSNTRATLDIPVTEDTYVESVQTDQIAGAFSYTIVDGNPIGNVFLRVNLGTLPTTTTVIAAELHIWTLADTGQPCDLYRVTEAWDEASATYNQRSTGTTWSGTGGSPPSRDTTSVGTFSPASPTTEYVVPIATALVMSWIATPSTNFGVEIASVNADGARFSSREASSNVRPFLRLTYRP